MYKLSACFVAHSVLHVVCAQPNAVNTMTNRTALFCAAESNNYHIADLLLEYGADPYIRDIDGQSPTSISMKDKTMRHLFRFYAGLDNMRMRQLTGRRASAVVTAAAGTAVQHEPVLLGMVAASRSLDPAYMKRIALDILSDDEESRATYETMSTSEIQDERPIASSDLRVLSGTML